MSRAIVVYYSYSHTTQKLAEDIALLTDSPLLQLTPEKPYDLTYHGATKEVRQEIERGFCPKLNNVSSDVDSFDRIYIGSPNWFKTFAPPILSFLRQANLCGKTVIPFCTHGGGGFGNMIHDMRENCPSVTISDGFDATSDYTFEEVSQWLSDRDLL